MGALECQNPDCASYAEVSFSLAHKQTGEVKTFYLCEGCARQVMAKLDVRPGPVTQDAPSLN